MRFLNLVSILLCVLFARNSYCENANSFAERINVANEIYYTYPDSSFQLSSQIKNDAIAANDWLTVGEAAHCIARYLILVTDYQNAGRELELAIQIFEHQNDFVKLSKSLALKSILLDRIGEETASTELLKEAYQISKDHGDRKGEISRLTNLTLDFIEANKPDSAYHYLIILESLRADIKDESNYFLEQNTGMYYELIGDLKKAVYYYQRAMQVSETYNMLDSKATIYAKLANAYRQLNMLNESLIYGLKSYEISINNNLVFEERDALVELVKTYEALNDFENSFLFQGKLIETDERINKIEKVQKLKEEEYKRDLLQKENEINQNKLQVQNEQLKFENSKAQNLILYFVIGAFILILFFTVYNYLKTRKLNRAIYLSKLIVEQKNNEILDSINYAKQIQEAILPPPSFYQSFLKDVQIFYRPKDIVAGDFYWFEKVDNQIYFAVADCTGHGVPGAMVSVICHSALNRALKEFNCVLPGEILTKTSELVVETFIKSVREVNDGMDIALCSFNVNTRTLTFAGANNPVWIMQKKNQMTKPINGEFSLIEFDDKVLVEIKGNKYPIGNSSVKQNFNTLSMLLNQGDTVYLSSDGYFDQFGGENLPSGKAGGKKLKSKVFKQKLLQIQNHDLQTQNKMIVSIFDEWKGELEQIDDVCVVGLRF